MTYRPRHSRRSIAVVTSCLAALVLVGCASPESGGGEGGNGGTSTGEGGSTGGGGTGGVTGASGATGTGGAQGGSTGIAGTSGSAGTTGAAGRGGTTGAAGTIGAAGTTGAAGTGAAGTTGVAGRGGTTGVAGTTGAAGTTGVAGRGGTTGGAGVTGAAGRGGTTGSAGTTGLGGRGGTTGAAGTTGAGGSSIDCMGTLPAGGTTRSSNNAQGNAAGMTWTIWTNSGPGTITYYDVPAFKASWDNSGDFLARLGLQWNSTKTYDQYGTITAQFASKKTGTAGGYSYVGIYGWSVSPCVEFYIVDDSYNTMPVNPGSTTNKGMVEIDGGQYILYTRNTTGSGGSKCGSSVTNWMQFYSIRRTARQCGQISITQHFNAWAAAGMTLGRMDQAQVLIEAGGGTGSIEFTTARVTATMP